MQIRLNIHEKSFPKTEMFLFSKVYKESTEVYITIYENSEHYGYETRNINGSLLLATKTGV